VAVLVGVFEGVLVWVAVGVGVSGRLEQEPVVLKVTDERKVVRYVTFIVAKPAPLIDVLSPGARSTLPDFDGSERLYVPSLTAPEILVITKVADKSTLQNTARSS